MESKVILFCGVESTGKSTAVELLQKYLCGQGKKVWVVSEYGRDVCENDGGVFDMTHKSYETILIGHQQNILNALNKEVDYVIVDTDSLYTRYYLEKDKSLFASNKKLSKNIIELANTIVKINLQNNRIRKVFYLNTDCAFVQDGTRTYESTRKQDDKYLFNMYKKYYKNKITVITNANYEGRFNQIINALN